MAGAGGATRRIEIKTAGNKSCMLWSAINGESGSQKTPAQEMALCPLEDLQAFQIEQLPELQRQYVRDVVLYESDKKNWHSKGRKKGDPPPEPPKEPSVARYIVGDSTIEARADRRHETPRVLLVVNYELSDWLGGMDLYTASKGRAWASHARELDC